MQCLRCGSEDFRTLRKENNRTPTKRISLRHDTRICQCEECGLTVKVACEVELISVYDGTATKQRWVTTGEYVREWLPIQQQQNPNAQTNIFDNE